MLDAAEKKEKEEKEKKREEMRNGQGTGPTRNPRAAGHTSSPRGSRTAHGETVEYVNDGDSTSSEYTFID